MKSDATLSITPSKALVHNNLKKSDLSRSYNAPMLANDKHTAIRTIVIISNNLRNFNISYLIL